MRVCVVLSGVGEKGEALITFQQFSSCAGVVEKVVIAPPGVELGGMWRTYTTPYPESTEALGKIFAQSSADCLMWVDMRRVAGISPEAVMRCVSTVEDADCALIYADYTEHPVNDYEPGSLRDTFDFGPFLFFNRKRLDFKNSRPYRYAGLYELRLALSRQGPFVHLREPLGRRKMVADRERERFSYLDSANREYQKEMEAVATEHLKAIEAYLPPHFFPLPPDKCPYPVEASVIIPVRNRVLTIREAVESALSQKAPFLFNVIVVDNHSTDGTSQLLSELARKYENLLVLRPERDDLNIGGCWNLAVSSPHCGRFAVQLDSDDIYEHSYALEMLVELLRSGPYAMVVGAYKLVDMDGKVLPPGLIDHREWTEENGRNNALRVEGFGAPRAFRTGVLRQIPFPNVSYGEDYAVALKISRLYRVGRIFDSLYLCRRWEGNSDARLTPEKENSYHAFKDRLRTLEIMARKLLNRGVVHE